MYKVGTRVIRVQTGQHYVISKIETKRADGSLFKKETKFYLKHERGSVDLIVREDELKTLFSPIKQTNADRIRSMTDEELAEWITNMCEFERHGEPYKSIYNLDTDNEEEIHDSYGDLLRWLKAESEE